MHLLIVKSLDKFQGELSNLLERCTTYEQITTHFSQYLLRQLTIREIEDYEFFPEFTPTETIVRVNIFFTWDCAARHEIIVKKKDCPSQAYTRAMGVV